VNCNELDVLDAVISVCLTTFHFLWLFLSYRMWIFGSRWSGTR